MAQIVYEVGSTDDDSDALGALALSGDESYEDADMSSGEEDDSENFDSDEE